MRAAFEWACTAGDGRLAYALVHPVVTEVSRRSRAELGDWIERVLTLASPGDTELVVFGLTWAAQRYKLGLDLQAWERLADKYEEPDHPLIRHARASASQDWETMARWAPPAMAELRLARRRRPRRAVRARRGGGIGVRRAVRRGDARIAALAQRYRAHAPPTPPHLSLALLGFSGRCRASATAPSGCSPLPWPSRYPSARTRRTSPSRRARSSEAATASGPSRMLADYIDQLLDTGNIQAICVALASSPVT